MNPITFFKPLVVAVALTFAATVVAQTRIIAHRGYWQCNGSAQNSLTSLSEAWHAGCYGSEFDVWITADGVCVVNHDPTIEGIRIETACYDDLRKLTLSNGEPLPTLDDYLQRARICRGLRLVLEVKPHSSPERENLAVDRIVSLVEQAGLAGQTDYISFSMHVCERLAGMVKDCEIAYLSGDVSPEEIKAKGLTGVDYHESVFKNHPEWIAACHELGLSVNVWTVDDLNHVADFIARGVDYITTNRPVEALKLARP